MKMISNEKVDVHRYIKEFLSNKKERVCDGDSVDVLRLIALELLEKYESSAEWTLDYHAISNEEREDLQKECGDWKRLIDYYYKMNEEKEL